MAEVAVRYYAGMVDRAGVEEETFAGPMTLGELQQYIVTRHGEAIRLPLSACSFLVNGRALTEPTTTLENSDHVEVLPPFAGG